MEYKHIPVLLAEVLEYLEPQPGQNFIDCTLGGAGYTLAIAKKISPKGKVLAIDLDDLAIKNAETRLKQEKLNNVIIVKDNFKNLEEIIKKNWLEGGASFSGVVLDLGLSSVHLDDRERGFSFQHDTPLDMAFGQEENSTVRIINEWGKKELERILREYGEEKYACWIAERIVSARKEKEIKTTGELMQIIEEAVPARYKNGKIHFATRTFQALRIMTNDELESLKKVLPQALEALEVGGRIVVVSYHSLEDRIVKRYFKLKERECICPPELPICQCNHKKEIKIITRKVLVPAAEEIKTNPRARSAKMRVVEKI